MHDLEIEMNTDPESRAESEGVDGEAGGGESSESCEAEDEEVEQAFLLLFSNMYIRASHLCPVVLFLFALLVFNIIKVAYLDDR